MKNRPSLQEIKNVLDEVDDMNLPDGAYWMMVHEKLNLEYGDVFEIIGDNPEFFGASEIEN